MLACAAASCPTEPVVREPKAERINFSPFFFDQTKQRKLKLTSLRGILSRVCCALFCTSVLPFLPSLLLLLFLFRLNVFLFSAIVPRKCAAAASPIPTKQKRKNQWQQRKKSAVTHCANRKCAKIDPLPLSLRCHRAESWSLLARSLAPSTPLSALQRTPFAASPLLCRSPLAVLTSSAHAHTQCPHARAYIK